MELDGVEIIGRHNVGINFALSLFDNATVTSSVIDYLTMEVKLSTQDVCILLIWCFDLLTE